jgi:hypothetical protein
MSNTGDGIYTHTASPSIVHCEFVQDVSFGVHTVRVFIDLNGFNNEHVSRFFLVPFERPGVMGQHQSFSTAIQQIEQTDIVPVDASIPITKLDSLRLG